jgi:ribonuclease Z
MIGGLTAMLNVLFMGTASASGSAGRENTYLLLERGEQCWMIDVGGNPLGKLKQAGISLARIQGVLLTHFHVDHIYGLPSLLWGMWIAHRSDPLTIYCSSVHKQQLTAILASYRVAEWPISFTIQIHDFDWTEPAAVISEEGLTVSTFPSLHVGAMSSSMRQRKPGVPRTAILVWRNCLDFIRSSASSEYMRFT